MTFFKLQQYQSVVLVWSAEGCNYNLGFCSQKSTNSSSEIPSGGNEKSVGLENVMMKMLYIGMEAAVNDDDAAIAIIKTR